MKLKRILIPAVAALFMLSFSNSFAQGHWEFSEENQFEADIISLLKSSENGFHDIQGKSVDSSAKLIEYESKKSLTRFDPYICKYPDGTMQLKAILDISEKESIDGASYKYMQELKYLLETTPDYKVYDSDNPDNEVTVPEGAERFLVVKSPSHKSLINVTLYLKGEDGIYILLAMGKK